MRRQFMRSSIVAAGLLVTRFVGHADEPKTDAKAIVQQAVKTELDANRNDHSRFLYLDVDQKPNIKVTQWVAETQEGDLHCVLEENGHKLSHAEQAHKMNAFASSRDQREQQKKAGKHDDDQATKLLKLLPDGFTWSVAGDRDGNTLLRFKPNPNFHPPDHESRVLAAMEGEMAVNDGQHRIVSIKGHLTRDVKFGGGLLATLKAGGTFDVERREIGERIWQITETHVHIEGHALLFRSISEQEDEQKSKFHQLASDVSLAQAQKELMQRGQ